MDGWMDVCAETLWVYSSNNQITCKHTCLNFRWQWYKNFGQEKKLKKGKKHTE